MSPKLYSSLKLAKATITLIAGGSVTLALNPVRVVDAFVDALDLATLALGGVVPGSTGRLSYYPSTILKIYIHGYLSWSRARVPSEPG
ncbi:MAG: hypothetical protein JXA57_13985 [Armatimonadetes bacterium]|nr:hypothetical protein [Armatimonadota bacterium]